MEINSSVDPILYYSTVQEFIFPLPDGCTSTEFSLSVREKPDWTAESMCDATGALDGDGNVTFTVDTFTQEFQRVCLYAKYAWLEIYTETEADKTVHLQRRIRIASRAGTLDGQSPPQPIVLYYTKTEVNTLLSSPFEFQFSADGENWHDSQADADIYMRVRNTATESATWSSAIRISGPWGSITGDISDQTDLQTQFGNYILTSQKGVSNGVAPLDADAKIPAVNLPSMDYIPNSEKGAASGVAPLDADAKVPSANLPAMSPMPIVASSAPTTSTAGVVGQLYVDTSTSKTYHCTVADTENSTYTWTDDINAMGGTFKSGIIIYGSSTNNLYLHDFGMIAAGYVCTSNGNAGGMAVGWSAIQTGGIGAIAAGLEVQAKYASQLVTGKYSVVTDAARLTGGGTSGGNKKNIEELGWNGNHYIAGGHQQAVTMIPADTTAYTLVEGRQQHSPSSVPTYTLPAILSCIITDNKYFTRNTSTDGTGYYGWISEGTNRYTASETPAVGDNTYANTGLTNYDARTITAIDKRTHEIVLTVAFSASVLSCSFIDEDGNTIAPLETPTIADGTIVRYVCTYEPLVGNWVIEPKVLKA